MWIATKA